MTDFTEHPCFSSDARHKTGRIHLPVAPKCNIKCRFCDRKYDCVNESRPGVTSIVLKPEQALVYLDSVLAKIGNISVIGIAGPGDPFANARETLQTLELVRQKYPDKLLCLATNGLELPEHVEQIARLNVSHVTVTVNAVEPEIGAKIYDWVRLGARNYRGIEGAKILLERQSEAVEKLKTHGITVKINTVIIPGINDVHAVDVAAYCKKLGADIQNCIPLMSVEGTDFANIPTPEHNDMLSLRKKAGEHLFQMTHCARCRADAVGIIGCGNPQGTDNLLREAAAIRTTTERPHVAVASREGLFVNRHLGEAEALLVYGKQDDDIVLLEKRRTPVPGSGNLRWRQFADSFGDCAAVLVSGCGPNPQKVLEENGLPIVVLEGLISESVPYVFNGRNLPKVLLRTPGLCGCGKACTGTGGGCG
ncbi:MAG: nitrogenase cofactor biosynthesis protein NifB [Planctomycetaceae bacterium]|jgi:nitrogen fixation protein NifB|nr:nitrogenase cofactor biosynthesis protein NifB [Planctomycetaceae bacterium]